MNKKSNKQTNKTKRNGSKKIYKDTRERRVRVWSDMISSNDETSKEKRIL